MHWYILHKLWWVYHRHWPRKGICHKFYAQRGLKLRRRLVYRWVIGKKIARKKRKWYGIGRYEEKIKEGEEKEQKQGKINPINLINQI